MAEIISGCLTRDVSALLGPGCGDQSENSGVAGVGHTVLGSTNGEPLTIVTKRH
jgi:hypothetical protein